MQRIRLYTEKRAREDAQDMIQEIIKKESELRKKKIIGDVCSFGSICNKSNCDTVR
jgi:hypothetical protein